MKYKADIANSVTADYIVTEVLSDISDDQGIFKEKAYRWLFRVWTQLNLWLIRTPRTVILPIATGTKTMMLPPDYQDFVFLGYVDDFGNDIPIAVNRNLAPQTGCETQNTVCETCGQTNLCSLDMQKVDEEVVIDGNSYTKTTTRILNPDGSYVEEVTQPVKYYSATEDAQVIMQTSRRVEVQLPDSCPGCVPSTPGNVQMLAACGCTDALWCGCSTDLLPHPVLPATTHYNLFEQEGFIQFEPSCCLTQAKLKYVSSGHCFQGVYYFPIAAMEALISGTYYRMIEKKRNVPAIEKDRARRAFSAEMKSLLRNFTRLSYQKWREMIDQIPRLPSLGAWVTPDMGGFIGPPPAVTRTAGAPQSGAPSLPPGGPGGGATDLGLRSVAYTNNTAATEMVIQVDKLGKFVFLIKGALTFDTNTVTQTGQQLDLTNIGGIEAGQTITIAYNP